MLLSVPAMSQTVYPITGTPKGTNKFAGAVIIDSMLTLPVANSGAFNYANPAQRHLGNLYILRADSLPYFNHGTSDRRPLFFLDTTYGIGKLATHYQLQWDSITNKPTTFTVSAHTHPINQVVGLQDSLTARYTIVQSNLVYIPLTQKAAANGVASLASNGRVPLAQLPNGIFVYRGTWNATTNSPTLVNGVGDTGDVYFVQVAGTHNFGAGNITFSIGDRVAYNGTIWQKWTASDIVTSVLGLTGAVTFTTDSVSEGATNKYYLDSRVSTYLVNGNGIKETAGVLGNDSLRVHGFGLKRATGAPNTFIVDTPTFQTYANIQTYVQSQIAAALAGNFFDADLVATGNRSHDMAGYTLAISNMAATTFSLGAAGRFSVRLSTDTLLNINPVSGMYWIGDKTGNGNAQSLTINDAGSFTYLKTDSLSVAVAGSGKRTIVASDQIFIAGDVDSAFNGSRIKIDDAIKYINVLSDSAQFRGKVKLMTVDTMSTSGYQFLVQDNTTKNVKRIGGIPYTLLSGLSATNGVSYSGGVIKNTGVISINGDTGVITDIIENGGNTFGTAATIGTNDGNSLNLETNNSTRVSITTTGVFTSSSDVTGSSGSVLGFKIVPNVNQSGTAGYTAFDVNVTETGLGSGNRNLMNLRVGNVSKVRINDSGKVLIGVSASTGQTLQLNGTARLDLGSDATGDVFYRASTGTLTRLALGTSGYALLSNGTIPAWTNLDNNYFKLNGNSFGGNATFGTNDNFPLLFELNGSNVGSWSNATPGGSFLVGATVFDVTSGMRLQVNGGIKATNATYSTGGFKYIVHNSTTSNYENTTTLPLLDTRIKRRQIADANTTISATDYILEWTTLTANRTATLPNANTMTEQVFYVKNRTNNALNSIVVTASGGQTIDGAATFSVTGEYKCVGFYSDGSNWWTLSNN